SVTKDLITWHFPQQRVAASWYNLATIFLPILLGYYVMAVLVQLPGTKLYRQALLPAVLWLTTTAGMALDFSSNRPEYAHLNQGLALGMFMVAMRVATWTLADKPYVKFCDADDQNGNVNKSESESSSSHVNDIYGSLWNALDLCCNLRGIGWNWSKGLHIARPMFKTESRPAFAALSLLRFILYTTALSAVYLSVDTIDPDGSNGWSIFDSSLPPLQRYLRSSFITAVTGFAAWMIFELTYQFHAFIFTLLFQQKPSQWPPISDQPWFATSLAMFWSRSWQQAFREWFMAIGSRPLEPYLGPYSPIGAFVLSGIFHEVGVRAMGRGGDALYIVGYFTMQGVGVVLERLYKRLTGKRVGGVLGFLWMWSWQIVWGNFVVDAWVRRGMDPKMEFFAEPFHPVLFIMKICRWTWETRTEAVI
ncbi:hypothetical protein V8B97DRAFT_1869353, partial [Scleroderma yunnanense]